MSGKAGGKGKGGRGDKKSSSKYVSTAIPLLLCLLVYISNYVLDSILQQHSKSSTGLSDAISVHTRKK